VRGTPVHLQPRQFEVMRFLASRPGQVIPHRTLLRAIWGPNHDECDAYLHVYISQLRRKIELDPAHPRIIITEPGKGYRFDSSPSAARVTTGLSGP
jgi:two-component system KDP operon response regulator KdpE